MSDDPQVPVEETPAPPANTPQGTGTEEQTPQIPEGYVPEDRYKEAQSWGTRLSQEKAQLEQTSQAWQTLVTSGDPDAQRQAAEFLGIELEEPTAEVPETESQLLARLEAVEQRFQTQEQEATKAENYKTYRSEVDPQLKQMGIPEGLYEVVADMALQLPALETPQGQKPDLQTAVEKIAEFAIDASELPKVKNQFFERYKGTKAAPHVSPVGGEGTQVPELKTHQQRVDYISERLNADA